MWPAVIIPILVSSFVGAQSCKLCHRPIYASWSETPHAHATERLSPAERTPECLRCHATGSLAEASAKASPALAGIQCEDCHGAGSNYWPAQIMMDRDKASAAGLITPGEEVCRTCHGKGIPGHRSDFTMPERDDRARAIH